MFVRRSTVRRCRLRAILALASLLVYVGCEPGGYSGPTGRVSGTVTLNGETVPQGCNVAFVSDAGYTASGEVGSGGRYQLSVAGEGNDIPAAEYKVCITSPAGEEMSEAEYNEMMDEQSEAGGDGPREEGQVQEEVIPVAFQSTASSGLLFEVKEGKNTINIKLK